MAKTGYSSKARKVVEEDAEVEEVVEAADEQAEPMEPEEPIEPVDPTETVFYLEAIDEEALGRLLELTRIGTSDVVLPRREVPDNVKVRLMDNCAVARGKGSLAGYALLEGMQEREAFEEGTFIGGTQCLPLVAFHERMYEAVIGALAEELSGATKIVAHNYENGKPGKPMTSVALSACEVYNQEYAAPGHVSAEVFVWTVG